jgi:hypothetical protein
MIQKIASIIIIKITKLNNAVTLLSTTRCNKKRFRNMAKINIHNNNLYDVVKLNKRPIKSSL